MNNEDATPLGGIQFVASILKDKLPEELNRAEFFVVKLSQGDKLFGIGG